VRYVKLVAPAFTLRVPFQDMAREYAAFGEHRYQLALRDFHAYMWRLDEDRQAENLAAGRSPQLELWLEHSGTLLGCARLRLQLTPELETEGGHIGYDVRPSKRRQGYGTQVLALALIEARSRGIERVRITCDADNEPSRRVIERHGGRFSGTARSPHSGKLVEQFWIDP
jgi:predicted acetyltransferase